MINAWIGVMWAVVIAIVAYNLWLTYVGFLAIL
jgi:hypothetical protein